MGKSQVSNNNINKITMIIIILTSHILLIVRVLNQASDEIARAFYLDNHDASCYSWRPSSRWKMKLQLLPRKFILFKKHMKSFCRYNAVIFNEPVTCIPPK